MPTNTDAPAMFLTDADLAFLKSLGECLAVLGLVGAVSLFFFPRDRRLQERALGLLFTLLAAGGVALIWRVDKLESAARDLSAAQQATLSQAISQFPAAKFQIFTNRVDREAHALTLKIVDAVKAGGGVISDYAEDRWLPRGVVLSFADDDVDLRRKFVDKIGRQFMAARIIVISDSKPDLGENTVRITLGEKP
jgi:hypothetical protein